MSTSLADALAVLEAEAIHRRAPRAGKIDPAARALIDQARQAGWQKWTIKGEKGRSDFILFFDGPGRLAYQQVLPPGLRDQVVCDGQTLLHLYPQLGLAAQRSVSRFHRADLAGRVPWLVLPAEDLAHGADVKLIDKNTIAVVAHITPKKDAKGKEPTTYQLRMVFANGRLAERQLVEMPAQKVLLRQVCQADGVVIILNEKGKELRVVRGKLAPAEQPILSPSTKELVVLELPYRSREYLIEKRKLQKVASRDLRFTDAIQLLATDVAAGNGVEAQKLFTEALHSRNQRQLGLYVLLASAGVNLDAQNLDVVDEHPDAPLAQYLALHSSPVLRKQASQWATSAVQWQDPLLKHLATTHALYQRWQSKHPQKWDPARLQAERQKALDYVRANQDSAFGWALLCLLQNQAGKDQAFYRELADCFQRFAGQLGLGYAARYEQARCLWSAGERKAAREKFTELYRAALARGYLPAMDDDLRNALLGDGKSGDAWGELLRQTAAELIQKKRRPAVLALAWQCRQLDDSPAADQLITLALDKITDKKERAGMTLAAVLFYRKSSQLPQADRLLRELLQDAEQAKRPELWRLASAIAAERSQKVPALRYLEKALDLEFRNLPEVINLKQVRDDYAELLNHYSQLAESMVALKVEPSPDFLAKVVRTADRWRSLDPQGNAACDLAAGILHTLGKQELAWDYLTTPVGMSPNESEPWVKLAEGLRQSGDLDLADKAFKAAYESEPTNAQILWDRAQNLRQAGKTGPAQQLLRQLAEGQWQPRFQGLISQAKLQLQGS
jgi:thioredoxin-like negative regulator of GroEL